MITIQRQHKISKIARCRNRCFQDLRINRKEMNTYHSFQTFRLDRNFSKVRTWFALARNQKASAIIKTYRTIIGNEPNFSKIRTKSLPIELSNIHE